MEAIRAEIALGKRKAGVDAAPEIKLLQRLSQVRQQERERQ